jgi:biotin carboxyl carrier protein
MQKPEGMAKRIGDTLWVHYKGRNYTVELKEESSSRRRRNDDATHNGVLQSPMPGKILKINVKPGDSVKKGQTVCVIEAMKMEYALKAPFDGKIFAIFKEQGASVALDEKIVQVEKKK